jgi:hypothetical protein
MNKTNIKPNRLINEKSPYLLQHAYNPVDWYAWGDEAFDKARMEDKPIFLSIGYSTCHWCHVMERESFEDSRTAALMNEVFVSIKVDREERPDIDHIYMTVCQMMTGSGGWPLNILMTPEKKPFFAGTYFPRESRMGRIGMLDLVPRISELWRDRRNEVLDSATKIMHALKQIPEDSPGMLPTKDVSDQAFSELEKRFDSQMGGFSEAPKFPTPHNMLFLLRYWNRTGNDRALEMVEKTLQSMKMGGIYDHVGYGFHRYSTDTEWLVPHFEKMLYDQALLSIAFTEAYQATGKNEYAETAQQILEYVMRDMTSPEGGFYSAEDADSEGEEGKFYVWTVEEVEEILGSHDGKFFASIMNFKPKGNYREESTGEFTGSNIPHITSALHKSAERLGMSESDLRSRLNAARKKLFDARESRVHPHKDDKILADWNGLMIAAFAKASQVFDRSDFGIAAKKAADFVLNAMRDADGRLLHRFRDNEAGLLGHADDYAFFVWGLIELHESLFEIRHLEAAIELNQQFVNYFWDESVGGFYLSAEDVSDVLIRKKELYDGATPSANSVSILNLLRLAKITADSELEQKAEMTLKAFAGNVRQFPSVYTQLLCSLEFSFGPSYEITIAGGLDRAETRDLLQALRKPFLPNKVVVLKQDENAPITQIADYTLNQAEIDGKPTAYVCLNYACELPTNDSDKMLSMINR